MTIQHTAPTSNYEEQTSLIIDTENQTYQIGTATDKQECDLRCCLESENAMHSVISQLIGLKFKEKI